MKTSKIIMAILIGVFLICSVSALDDLGRFKRGESVRITQVCEDATYINISSITYPDSTIAIANINMTSAGSGEFYYDFNATSYNGRYDVRGISDGCEKTFATYFDITQNGFLGTIGFYSLIFILSLGIIILGLSLKDAPITILGSLGLYFVGLYVLFNGIEGIKDPVYTWGLGIITLGLAFYISTKSSYELITSE